MGTGQRPIICQVVALCSQSRSCPLRQGGVPEGALIKQLANTISMHECNWPGHRRHHVGWTRTTTSLHWSLIRPHTKQNLDVYRTLWQSARVPVCHCQVRLCLFFF